MRAPYDVDPIIATTTVDADVYAPPEIILAHRDQDTMMKFEGGSASDMWALGCTIFDAFGAILFAGVAHAWNSIFEDQLALVGEPSVRYWEWVQHVSPFLLKRVRKQFDEDGKPVHEMAEKMCKKDWDYRLKWIKMHGARGGKRFPVSDKEVLKRILKALLRLDPDRRIDAEALVEMMPKEWTEGEAAAAEEQCFRRD